MMPGNAFSLRPLPAPYEAPRTVPRFDAAHGAIDYHLGGIALGDASKGITYQLWTCYIANGGDIWLKADNVPAFPRLTGVNAVWVAFAIDQSGNDTICYVDKNNNLFYFWFDSTLSHYRTSQAAGSYSRVFCAFDDNRVQMLTGSDVIIVYQRAGNVYALNQRDRFGVEYTLGASPGTLVQFGMNKGFRMQFQFQNVQKSSGDVPAAEYQLNVGGVVSVP